MTLRTNNKLLEDRKAPFVSIVMPVLNERLHIAGSLDAAVNQDYPSGSFEIIVADGLSDDGTREIIEEKSLRSNHIKSIDNPGKIVSTGLNLAIGLARGEIVVRMDAHNSYPTDYLRSLVDLLRETSAANVGGVLEPTGTSPFGKSTAAAFHAPIAIGVGMRGHRGGHQVREVDTVTGGCWKKETLLKLGLFDESLVRNQDDEFNFRLRAAGGHVLQTTRIRIQYAVRESPGKLFKQFLQYGYWKIPVLVKHPRQGHWRHYAPGVFVLTTVAMLACLATGMIAWEMPALMLLIYLSGVAGFAFAVTRHKSDTSLILSMLALALMHFGYGTGFVAGLVKRLTGWDVLGDSSRSLSR
jgi:glycosyltransferase involved in cell wall biosynthesis